MVTRKCEAGRYSGRLSAAIHETASGLHRIGLMETETMREFDSSCSKAVENAGSRRDAATSKAN
jgi:DNA-binding transcriptional regulator YiaG